MVTFLARRSQLDTQNDEGRKRSLTILLLPLCMCGLAPGKKNDSFNLCSLVRSCSCPSPINFQIKTRESARRGNSSPISFSCRPSHKLFYFIIFFSFAKGELQLSTAVAQQCTELLGKRMSKKIKMQQRRG